VLVPKWDLPLFERMKAELDFNLVGFDQHPTKGMLHHEAMICRADEFCKADFILHTDSDCHFVEPVTPEDFIFDGKPVLVKKPFAGLEKITPNSIYHHWKEAAEAALGFEVEFETMCRHPTVHYSWLYKQVREHIEKHVRMPFDEYVLSQRNEFPQSFAEFTTLGAYVIKFHHDKYYWFEAVLPPGNSDFDYIPYRPPDKSSQRWSHGGISPELSEELCRVTAL
jgi:hypothetical protein